MTQPTFEMLIDDHDAIERKCREVLAVASSAGIDDVYAALHDLADRVSAHLAVEDALTHDLFDRAVPAMQSVGVTKGQLDAALMDLRADWLEYLCRWSKRAMQRERSRFIDETMQMLGRLSVRVQLESEIFYDVLLQAGVIDMAA